MAVSQRTQRRVLFDTEHEGLDWCCVRDRGAMTLVWRNPGAHPSCVMKTRVNLSYELYMYFEDGLNHVLLHLIGVFNGAKELWSETGAEVAECLQTLKCLVSIPVWRRDACCNTQWPLIYLSQCFHNTMHLFPILFCIAICIINY